MTDLRRAKKLCQACLFHNREALSGFSNHSLIMYWLLVSEDLLHQRAHIEDFISDDRVFRGMTYHLVFDAVREMNLLCAPATKKWTSCAKMRNVILAGMRNRPSTSCSNSSALLMKQWM